MMRFVPVISERPGPQKSLISLRRRAMMVAAQTSLGSCSRSQCILNDFNSANVVAVEKRMRALGGTPVCYNDVADVAVDKIVAAVKPSGLHFAFLDPYNLEALSFDIIRKLSKLQRVDMLIHVSVQDLQRNLDDYSKSGGVFDKFAPGWSDHVDRKQAIKPFRAALMNYWLGEIRKLGKKPAEGVELVVGSKRQRLYWLVFVSAEHALPQKLWEAIRDPMRQTRMDV
jgi:three-Cys-motif partner protein